MSGLSVYSGQAEGVPSAIQSLREAMMIVLICASSASAAVGRTLNVIPALLEQINAYRYVMEKDRNSREFKTWVDTAVRKLSIAAASDCAAAYSVPLLGPALVSINEIFIMLEQKRLGADNIANIIAALCEGYVEFNDTSLAKGVAAITAAAAAFERRSRVQDVRSGQCPTDDEVDEVLRLILNIYEENMGEIETKEALIDLFNKKVEVIIRLDHCLHATPQARREAGEPSPGNSRLFSLAAFPKLGALKPVMDGWFSNNYREAMQTGNLMRKRMFNHGNRLACTNGPWVGRELERVSPRHRRW